MRKYIALALLIFTLLPVLAAMPAAAADIYAQTDVPKIFITTQTNVTRDYCAAAVRVIDKKGGTEPELSDTGAKVKIRGNSTSSGAKKPFNIKFSSKTDLLGMGRNKKWCLLANCYEKTLLRNQTVLDFSAAIGLAYTPKYRVCDVYLNEKFLGSYLVTDAIGASKTRVDIDTDANEFILERDSYTDEGTTYFTTDIYGIRFGINEPDKQTAEQKAWLFDFVAKAERALAGGSLEEIEKYFDVDSMVDFYIVLEYFKNVDVGTGSTRFYIKNGRIYGGPVWDFDLSAGNCSSDYYRDYNNIGTSGNSWEGLWCECMWFRPLLSMPFVREKVAARYAELQDEIINLYADNTLGRNYIDRMLAKYGESFRRNYKEAGWSDSVRYNVFERTPDKGYEANLAYYRAWLEKRNEWLKAEWGIDDKITLLPGSGARADGWFIRDIKEKTAAGAISADADAFFGGKKLMSGEYLPTGAVLTRGGAGYCVVVRGDISANGVLDSVDYLYLKRLVLQTVSLGYAETLASDITGDGRTDAYDYLLLKRHVLGTYNIYG